MSTYATYIGTDGQKKTGLVSGSAWEGMKEYYDQLYAGQLEANQAAAQASRDQAQAQLQSSLEQLNQEYRDTGRQLYRDYMQSKKNLSQTLAAQGYTGGLTETGRIALEAGYQESVSAGARQRQAETAQLRQTAAKAEETAAQTLAQANREAQEAYYANYAGLLEKIQEEERYQAQQEAARDETEYQRLLARAQSLAKYGNFSGYLALGYTQAEVDAMRAVWKIQNPKLP